MLLLMIMEQVSNFERYQNDFSSSPKILISSNDTNTSLRTYEGKIVVNYNL